RRDLHSFPTRRSSDLKVALEKLVARLSSASDFGDLVIVLSPAMSVVKNLRSLLTPHVAEMEVELGIISELLSGILVDAGQVGGRSEEHTSELQSRENL